MCIQHADEDGWERPKKPVPQIPVLGDFVRTTQTDANQNRFQPLIVAHLHMRVEVSRDVDAMVSAIATMECQLTMAKEMQNLMRETTADGVMWDHQV